jgi:hypothetical protein
MIAIVQRFRIAIYIFVGGVAILAGLGIIIYAAGILGGLAAYFGAAEGETLELATQLAKT